MTEDLWRTETVAGELRHPKSHWNMEQIVCQPIVKVALLALIMCLLNSGLTRADFQAGLDAYERKDYNTALEEWQPLAQKGESNAQFRLGEMYFKGEGVPQDYAVAIEWYRKAAEQGHAESQFRLAGMYSRGEGVIENDKEALKWYRTAAEQGNVNAQFHLGTVYARGEGVVRDYRTAIQ